MSSNYISLGNLKIGKDQSPLIISELSGNHNGSLERALKVVDAVAEAGGKCIKLQTYTPDTMTLDCRDDIFFIADPGSPWEGRYLYDLYKEAYTPWEWHRPIMDRCEQLGIMCFSTPFDETAVDFLEELKVPCYKIASFEMTDLPLITKIAKTKKPVIMSTGMATLQEIAQSVDHARKAGIQELVLLKCTSSYPADPSDSNIAAIPLMMETFKCPVGLSDHTLGIGAALGAIALGAVAIEKHITLARKDGGVDSAFSLEPMELKALIQESERVYRALGKAQIGPSEAEKKSLLFRRSLMISRSKRAGDVLSIKDVRRVRPGHGLPPGELDKIIGLQLKKDVAVGTPVSWDLFKESE